ncbi:hemerythrin domain-containing protein [Methylocystis parvus]|uniref:Hemerythrin domain-containing protein n=2 Tax=Methylocystis parvus TaxID=134 RepID=A0A6B8M9Q7_9HYPH|nr:hemerythrin domain-containing protein [Methylocystis parvus]
MEPGDEDISAKATQEKSEGNGGGQKADAIEMLKTDHRRVEDLFSKYEHARRRAEKSKLAQQISLELTIHAELEEEIFYPACREHVDDPLLDEAQVEHDTAKILIAEIAMGAPQNDPFFDAKVTVLGEYVRAHIQEEEKNPGSIFAKALEGGVDTAKLGQRMMARREELMDEFSEELLLPQPKALHIQLAQEEELWAEPPGRAAAQGQGRGMQNRDMLGRGGREERGGWEERELQERRFGEYDRDQRPYDESRSARGGQMAGRGEAGRTPRESTEVPEGERTSRGGEGRGVRRGGGEEHRGWHGDPKRHSEASRKGWEHRR